MKLKKIGAALAGLFLFTNVQVKADEGMWLPMFLHMNYEEMKAMGLELTPEQMYSASQSSLKDAIVSLGGFCTGEIISPKGLMLTNHHCGYDAIASNSTPENNRLAEGFWAKSMADEIPIQGLYARFVVRMEDVTERVLESVSDDMSESDRNKALAQAMDEITAEAIKDSHYDGEVKPFFEGNNFYLFIYETFRDVRLVGAPPESVGKYGGDTDNWMWPRHTGDFSMFRVYSGPDGMPAEYSEENVHMTPRHFLPISMDGIENGDFSMIFGFPGSTDRFLTSFGVDEAINISQPTIVDIRDKKLEIMRKYMDADPAVRLTYASKYAQVANYWKYYIGQTRGLKRLNVLEKKRRLEADFIKWVNADPKRQEKYGEALAMVEESYNATNKTVKNEKFLFEAGLLGPDAILYAWRQHNTLSKALEKKEDAVIAEAVAAAKERAESHFAEYSAELDRELFVEMMVMYYNTVPKAQLPSIFDLVDEKFKGDVRAFAEEAAEESMIFDKEEFYDFLEKPKAKKWNKDLVVQTALSFIQSYFSGSNPEVEAMREKGNRLFVAGLREMNADKNYYPNANSTLRVTYGTVGDYVPEDAVHYDYYTTAEGILQKMDNSDPEFVVPSKLEKLIRNADYGQYANENGELPVCFISNNDITGGNSGSPVINGRGELIGLAFDGNWEAMSGDIAFEPNLQRTISVDIRYVLFIVDKYAGASHIIQEMKLVRQPVEETAEVEE